MTLHCKPLFFNWNLIVFSETGSNDAWSQQQQATRWSEKSLSRFIFQLDFEYLFDKMFCSSQAGDRTATGMWKTETEKLKFVVQTGCKFFLIYQCLGHNSDWGSQPSKYSKYVAKILHWGWGSALGQQTSLANTVTFELNEWGTHCTFTKSRTSVSWSFMKNKVISHRSPTRTDGETDTGSHWYNWYITTNMFR